MRSSSSNIYAALILATFGVVSVVCSVQAQPQFGNQPSPSQTDLRNHGQLIAQSDNDMPPELRSHLKPRAGTDDDGGASTGASYGGRPFRRPQSSQDNSSNDSGAPMQPRADGGSTPASGPGAGGGPNAGPGPREGAGANSGLGPREGGFGFGNTRRGPLGGGSPEGFRRRFGNKQMGANGMPPGGPGSDEGPPGARFRHGGPEGGGGGLFGRKPLDFSVLNLTEDQKQRIQQIRTNNGARAREYQQGLKDRRQAMRDLMFDASASDEQIRSKLKEVRQMQEKMDDVQINDFLAIRKVLTSEQRQRLAELKPGARKMAIDQPNADNAPPLQPR